MRRGVIWSTSTLFVIASWSVINFFATSQGWFLETIAEKGNTAEFVKNINARIESNHKGNAAMLMLENGKLVAQQHVSKGAPVDQDSIFGVASLGKWVAAVAVMKLVEQGKLDLDTPVSNYLTRWQLPASEFDNDGVTVRRLLSHTAGITDGLGHDGFPPGTKVQPLVEHLTLASDREPDKSGRVAVGMQPGSTWQYSGGSYNLLQLLIEEVSKMTFSDYMQDAIFTPLNMENTSYVVDRNSAQTAEYYGENQELMTYPNYTSLAATGLYSTTSDLAKFVRSQIPSTALTMSTKRIISDNSILSMHQALGNASGLDIWGAGVMLFAENNNGNFVIGHGGRSPMLNATARLDPATGNAFIMIQTGNKEAFASNMATKWTNWQTGKPDMFQLRYLIPDMFNRILIGSGAIIFFSVLSFFLTKRKYTNK